MDSKISRSKAYTTALLKLFKTTHLDSDSFLKPLINESITNNLNRLDTELSLNRINFRNIKNHDYIREIYDSHLITSKVTLKNDIIEMKETLIEQRNKLKNEVEKMKTECEKMQMEVNECMDVIVKEMMKMKEY